MKLKYEPSSTQEDFCSGVSGVVRVKLILHCDFYILYDLSKSGYSWSECHFLFGRCEHYSYFSSTYRKR